VQSVLISIPTSPANPYIHKGVVRVLPGLYADKRYRVKVIFPSHNPFENNLHHIVKDFVAGKFDYWLSIDSDNPPLRNPLDLIVLDKDIMGLPTPVVHFDDDHLGDRPVYWNAYKYVLDKDGYKPYEPMTGLQRVDAIGTGCFIVAKRVFQNREMLKAPFARVLNEDGTVERGNDIAFCERATNQGFEIWAHFDYTCQHFNEVEVNEMVQHFREFFKLNPE